MDKIFTGDALTILRTLPPRIVQTCVTSPPYWGLRDYGVKGQLGLEKTPDQYVARIVELFREVRRVLREDGTLWLNLGDSYAGSWGNYGGQNRGAGRQRAIRNGSVVPNPAYDGLEGWRPPTAARGLSNGIKNKDLVGIPWRVAFALQADGWYLRQDIIWHKPNPMPESVTDRCTKAHEYLFFLSKSRRYYFDGEAIKERAAQNRWSGKKPMNLNNTKDRDGIFGGLTRERDMMPEYRNRRSVWTVATKPYRGAHFATFPSGLIEPCISAGAPTGGLVLDPFLGSGTTAAVASALQRQYIGIELNPAYVKLARGRLRESVRSATLVAAE